MSASDLVKIVVHQTRSYRVEVAELIWEGSVKGTAGYRVINKDTDVCEGEGSILATAKVYTDKLQAMLDQYDNGESDEPLGRDVN